MVKVPFTLADLSEGQSGCIRGISVTSPLGQRLLDLGFTPGTQVTALRHAPLGDPTTFLIRGYRIGLRKQEAGLVDLSPPGSNDPQK
jgi:Fe2+ transport system protein FeoA